MFDGIASGDASAWKNPAVTAANTRLQELAKAGAFGDNASSVNYDLGASTALLYAGKAGMELMGTREYANLVEAAPELREETVRFGSSSLVALLREHPQMVSRLKSRPPGPSLCSSGRTRCPW
ncbi:hypothetical protein ABZ307_37055 [Streptomyces griseorubiginosus]|uniref:hypothetical protein n=1 Tax=Streptomyces griseorubiginosus TaxID=67304 RepID=UPI0033A0177D